MRQEEMVKEAQLLPEEELATTMSIINTGFGA